MNARQGVWLMNDKMVRQTISQTLTNAINNPLEFISDTDALHFMVLRVSVTDLSMAAGSRASLLRLREAPSMAASLPSRRLMAITKFNAGYKNGDVRFPITPERPHCINEQIIWRKGDILCILVGPDIDHVLEDIYTIGGEKITEPLAKKASELWINNNLGLLTCLVTNAITDWDVYPDIDNMPYYNADEYRHNYLIHREQMIRIGIQEQYMAYIPANAMLKLPDSCAPLYDASKIDYIALNNCFNA